MLQMSIINPDSAKRKKTFTNLGNCLSMAGCHSHHYRIQRQLAISESHQEELIQPGKKKKKINIQEHLQERVTPASELPSHFLFTSCSSE